MSRAFVNEDQTAAGAAEMPERPVPPGPNPVTPSGRLAMEAEAARLAAALDAAPEEERPALSRDLRYWRARIATAQVVEPTPGPAAGFGRTVRLRQGGREQVWRIVGEDEADPKAGTLSWASPLAQALMGAEPGDEVALPGRPPMTVLAVD
jgi:transcription elongation GreA/GreB family factor